MLHKAEGKESSRFIEVLMRSVDILELFLSEDELRLKDIHRLTGLQKNRIMRICGTLVTRDYLCFDPETKTYTPGPMLFLLGRRYDRNSSKIARIREALLRLADSTGETTTFSIASGVERICMALHEGKNAIRFSVEEGSKTPIYAGAGGKVLLAFMSQERAKKIIDNIAMIAVTPQTVTSKETLLEQLEEIRSCGYAVSLGENIPNAAGLAAPVFGMERALEGVVNVAGPAVNFDEGKFRRYLPDLLEICSQLSTLLGCPK
ncbi:IclR family transcriptional regulator [Synergistaceae bacterium OttesenSCG-928-I11]|nr:IclR family transcriptional regulator [Synergistaceae bacterium OttesenSCG-928-I11]